MDAQGVHMEFTRDAWVMVNFMCQFGLQSAHIFDQTLFWCGCENVWGGD